jgi:hypothetical protein
MSHVAIIDLAIDDLDSLRRACSRLGLELVQQDTYRWFGYSVGDYPLPEGFTKDNLGRCQYAIRFTDQWMRDHHFVDPSTGEILRTEQQCSNLSGEQRRAMYQAGGSCEPPYEVGVTPSRTQDGRYVLLWDFWCGGFGLEKAVGQNAGLLQQAYAIERAKAEAARQGYQCKEVALADGSISLEIQQSPFQRAVVQPIKRFGQYLQQAIGRN